MTEKERYEHSNEMETAGGEKREWNAEHMDQFRVAWRAWPFVGRLGGGHHGADAGLR